MKRITPLVAAAGMMLGAAAAQATPAPENTTATQTITFGPGLTDFNNASQNLNLFDSNLGTLLSVTISATYGFNSSLTITNSAATASSGNVRTESAAGFGSSVTAIDTVIRNLIDLQGPLTIGGTSLNAAAFDLLGTRSNYGLASGQSTTGTSIASTTTIGPVTDSNAADLHAFLAASGGLFDVLFDTATGTLLSNTGGNTGATENTTATGSLSIYYTYTADPPPPPSPVPEPGAIALLGTALLGLGILRGSIR